MPGDPPPVLSEKTIRNDLPPRTQGPQRIKFKKKNYLKHSIISVISVISVANRVFPERYRSGRNGVDSKSTWGPKALTWVRIPPSPPKDENYGTQMNTDFQDKELRQGEEEKKFPKDYLLIFIFWHFPRKSAS